jgi:hypothetical protein
MNLLKIEYDYVLAIVQLIWTLPKSLDLSIFAEYL